MGGHLARRPPAAAQVDGAHGRHQEEDGGQLERIEIRGEESGLHLVATLPRGFDDQQVAKLAAERNVWAWPLSPCYLGTTSQQGLVLGFGSTTPEEIEPAVRRLKRVLDELSRYRGTMS